MLEIDPVHSCHIDNSRIGKDRIFDAWREIVRDVYDVNLLEGEMRTEETGHSWLVDSLIFSDVTFSSQSLHHGVHHAKNANYLSLQTYTSGGCQGLIDDASFRMDPNDVYVFDFSRVIQSSTRTSQMVGVVIPHDVVGYDPGRHPPFFRFPVGARVTEYLRNAFLALHGQLSTITRQEANIMAEGFCGLLRSLLSLEHSEETAFRKTLEERTSAMRSYLDQHLTDPDLSVDKICDAFNVSQATVYRCFAESGGLGHHIMQRRLDRAFFQLVSTRAGHGRISEIAYKVGFDDPLHFSRVFRKRFGCPPSMVSDTGSPEEEGAESSPQVNPVNKFGDWIRSISA